MDYRGTRTNGFGMRPWCGPHTLGSSWRTLRREAGPATAVGEDVQREREGENGRETERGRESAEEEEEEEEEEVASEAEG